MLLCAAHVETSERGPMKLAELTQTDETKVFFNPGYVISVVPGDSGTTMVSLEGVGAPLVTNEPLKDVIKMINKALRYPW
jgi:hypothetical protein